MKAIRSATFVGFVLLLALASNAATRYVDSSVATSGNGQSWATAWKNTNNITGLSAGDIVYFSPGAYTGWTLTAGNSSNPITYKAGQDAGHIGVATFSGTISLGDYTTLDGGYNGAQNFSVSTIYAAGTAHTIVRYVSTNGSWNYNGNTTYFEIDHITTTPINADHFISFNGPTQLTWDANKIHDSVINLAHDTSANGLGTDGLQNVSSLSFYNNVVTGVKIAGAQGNHQDGIQTDGRYLKIYNNVFKNLANYMFFFEGYSGGSDVRVYNNVFIYDDPAMAGGYQQAIAIGEGWNCATANAPFQNFVVANNTVVDKIGLGNDPISIGVNGCSDLWSSTLVTDNVVYSISGQGISLDTRIPTSGSNKTLSSGGTSVFADYTNNNFHLNSSSSVLRDQGVSSPSTYFTTDKDGVNRPQGGAWDVGAYEYGSMSAGPTSPTNLFAIVK